MCISVDEGDEEAAADDQEQGVCMSLPQAEEGGWFHFHFR